MEKCKVITDKGYLFLTMPDGTIIPHQTKMTLENNVDMEDVSMVTITVMADTKFIKNRLNIMTNRNDLTKEQRAEMLEKLKSDHEQNNT